MCRDVETGDCADFWVRQRSHDLPEITRLGPHVAVVDHERIVVSFLRQASQFGHFVVGGVAPRTVEQSDVMFRKVHRQFLDDGNHRIGGIAYTKQNFISWIILFAEAGEVLVGIRIESTNWFENADWRSVRGMRVNSVLTGKEVSP